MKRLLYICLAALLTAVSCDKTPEEVAAAITPTGDAAALFTNGLKVAASASTTKVSFTATRDWSVVAEDTKALASWVAVTPASGKAGNCEVTVNVQGYAGHFHHCVEDSDFACCLLGAGLCSDGGFAL